MPTLKQARKGKIDDFTKEHEADPDGGLDKFDEVIGRSKKKKQGATPAKKTAPSSPIT